MPRRKRIVLPCFPHHIVQRGHDRRAVFIAALARENYPWVLAESRTLLGIKVYAYCLIVDPGTEAASLSQLMKRLAGRHTRRIDRLERRSGTAWNGRFKCSPIETDRYLIACSRYVDSKPVRACVVAHPADYPWSSYRSQE